MPAPSVSDSVLQSTKKVLGIDASYTAFDIDIIMHINTAFATLSDLGIGPDGGFMITDGNQVWSTFFANDIRFNRIRSYVYLFVRRLFDPPNTGYLSTAMDNQIRELEWRIMSQREEGIVLVEEEVIYE